jgi:hypothetical protein
MSNSFSSLAQTEELFKAYLYADNQSKHICKNMGISYGATCRTLGCRCCDFQSVLSVGFQPFVEANAPFLDLPPSYHVLFIAS